MQEQGSGGPVVQINFSLRGVVRAGLIWAAEYAMLSLVEDSSELSKVATLVCACVGLLVLQAEQWLRSRSVRFFWGATIAIFAIWLIFAVNALASVMHMHNVQNKLKRLYIEGGELVNISAKGCWTYFEPQFGMSANEFVSKSIDWEKRTAEYLTFELGDAARTEFLDRTDAIVLFGDGTLPELGPMCAYVRTDAKHLRAIMGVKAYEN